MASGGSGNISNLNIVTFIKDIYQSLKHIDMCFNTYRENIDSRIGKLEDNQQIILEKLNNIEQILSRMINNSEKSSCLDSKLEQELMIKMNNLNNSTSNAKLELKPKELTFANILENNYTILDINESLAQNNISNATNESLESLLF